MKLSILSLSTLSLMFSCSGNNPDIKTSRDSVANPEKPNIVFIFADDMDFSNIHALGNREIKTPNLDRLVHRGTTFTHAYNMGTWVNAVCVASRAMLITGRSVWRAQDSESYQHDLVDRGEM